MRRRPLLCAIAGGTLAGLGGCVSAPTPGSEPQGKSASPTPPPGLQRRVSIAEEDPVPEGYDVHVVARLLEATITDEHTARIRITVTNEGPEREIAVSTGGCALLNRYGQSSRPRGVWLARGEDLGYVSENGPEWIAEPPEDGGFPDYGCAVRTFATGESVSVEYAVYDDARAGGYLPRGRYWFEREAFFEP
ncbi:MAG: hypothetical protein R3324_14375, partial [Halobacteriales archaeon]|nr:hypothetical protein [Halobacteriales archaeon]